MHYEERVAPTASIVIPAHDEASSIAKLLSGLVDASRPGEFEIVVVCNGCSDDTAARARRFEAVTVVEIPEPSKRLALNAGDSTASAFPRLYIDADIEIGASDVRRLIEALGPALASAPERVLPRVGTSVLVRAYYDVWERLPQVKAGLFGRGVIAMTADGHARVSRLPPMMSDDLAISEAFSMSERQIVGGARAIIRPPRTMRDLLRRRIRVHTGNAQMDQGQARSAEAKTSFRDLWHITRESAFMAPRVVVFAGVAIVAKLASRRRIRTGDFTTWLRDESSRSDQAVGESE